MIKKSISAVKQTPTQFRIQIIHSQKPVGQAKERGRDKIRFDFIGNKKEKRRSLSKIRHSRIAVIQSHNRNQQKTQTDQCN